MRIEIDLDDEQLKEFLDDHYGYEECEQELKNYTDEEIEIAIKDAVGVIG